MAQRSKAPPGIYRIRVGERLEPQWSEWLDGLTVEYADPDGGETILSGPVIDQAALHGVLMKIRDMGLTLLSVVCVEPDCSSNNGTEQKGRIPP